MPTEEEMQTSFIQLSYFFIGYYLGDMKPGETGLDGLIRALGYSNVSEFCKGIESEDGSGRLSHAIKLLWEKFGISSNDTHEEIADGFVRMRAGIPYEYRRELPDLFR
jgi:hypothetical protein